MGPRILLVIFIHTALILQERLNRHDRGIVKWQRGDKLRRVPPQGALGGGSLGVDVAVAAGPPVYRTLERDPSKWASAQVRV